MATWSDFFILIGVIAVWTVVLYVLEWRGVLKRLNLVPMGPFLMAKTRRGRDFIDRTARARRGWAVFGDLSIVIVAVAGITITGLLLWEATLVRSIPPERAPTPEMLLGLPGLNPLIPLGYGIFALAIAVGIHEVFHGIVARAAKVKIESLGLLFLIVPIGAFVEPSETELMALPRRERARIFSAGASINVLLALLFGFLFSTMMLSVQPAQEGVGIIAFTSDSAPALRASMPVGSIITSVNNTTTPTLADFQVAMARTHPGQEVWVVAWKDGVSQRYTVVLGDDGKGRPILGIQAVETSTSYYHPLTDADRFGGVAGALLVYFSLPATGRAPIQPPMTDFYVITGPLAALPAPVFYLIANGLYWLFWLNLALGGSNALPAVPLDGGHVFQDGVDGLLAKVRRGMAPERRQRAARIVSYVFALLILALIVWQFVGPRLPY